MVKVQIETVNFSLKNIFSSSLTRHLTNIKPRFAWIMKGRPARVKLLPGCLYVQVYLAFQIVAKPYSQNFFTRPLP